MLVAPPARTANGFYARCSFEHGQLLFASQNRPSSINLTADGLPIIERSELGASDDRLGQGSLNLQAPIFLNFGTHLRRDQVNWFSVQANAAIIAGVVSLSITLIMVLVAIILTNRNVRQNFKLEFAAEGVAREMLMDRNWPYCSFRVLKYHLSGFTDDELRKILVRAGGIRLTAGGQEVWGLLSRNREYLSVEEIKEAPTTQTAFDPSGQQQMHQQQQQEGGPQELDISRDSSGAFERVRAEMIKLGTLECVGPAARQK